MKPEATWKITKRATEADRRIVFNRSDCPYGCGAELPPKLRWQATPCPRCGRPLYPLGPVIDEEGRVLWPPANVRRSSEEGQPGVRVQYIVTDIDVQERTELARPGHERYLEGRNRSDKRTYVGCLLIVVVVVVLVVAWVLSVLLAALDLA